MCTATSKAAAAFDFLVWESGWRANYRPPSSEGKRQVARRLSIRLRSVRPHRLKDSKWPNRETQVLKLIAKEQTNKAIGHELEISMKTAEFDRSNAARKLGLGNRPQIAKYALVRGWLQNS